MDKLIVISGDAENREFILDRQRMSLGRDQSNEICLSDKSVSRNHANLIKVLGQYFLEDAKSTNGTRLNGQEIKKHILSDGDEIDIGKYKLRFQVAGSADDEDIDKTIVMNPRHKQGMSISSEVDRKLEKPATKSKVGAHVKFLNGPDKGDLKEINKSFFTIGQPGGDLIVINRRHTGYFLLKMGGDSTPLINGAAVRAGGVELQNGDRVVLGELDFEFVL